MFLSKYGVARHIYIPIPKAGSANHAVGADWTPAAGDVKISKDGGAAANVTNLPTAIAMGNSTVWDFSLTATEIQAAQVVVTISDSATKAVDDTGFIVETYGNASAQHAFDLGTASTPQTVDAATRMATYTQPTGFLATDFTTLGSNASSAAGNAASAYSAALDASNYASSAATNTSTLLTNLASLAGKFTGITLLKNWLGALAGKTADTGTRAEINATTAGAGYNETTDSLEAVRDRGDAAWVTGGGGGGGGDATLANQTEILNRIGATGVTDLHTELSDLNQLLTAVQLVLEADLVVDKTTNPAAWELVWYQRGTLIEQLRKPIKDVDGNPIASTGTVVGAFQEP